MGAWRRTAAAGGKRTGSGASVTPATRSAGASIQALAARTRLHRRAATHTCAPPACCRDRRCGTPLPLAPARPPGRRRGGGPGAARRRPLGGPPPLGAHGGGAAPGPPRSAAAKWEAYYDREQPPWDSHRPASQLVEFLTSCTRCEPQLPAGADDANSAAALAAAAERGGVALPPQAPAAGAGPPPALHACAGCAGTKPPRGGAVLEAGCGSGASAAWLAAAGFAVTGIDIVPRAVAAAAAGAARAGLPPDNPRFMVHDVFDAQRLADELPGGGGFDALYDCQTYHALRADHARGAGDTLPALLFRLLRPGGLLLLLAGNAAEPAAGGPAALTAHELLGPLLGAGFELVQLQATRFDPTPHYEAAFGRRPLAWWLVARRPAAGAGGAAG
ncbi:iccD [Scenedesmus sp. PABB004]|nr:iccD [Scenedesmus sp. PABB004]